MIFRWEDPRVFLHSFIPKDDPPAPLSSSIRLIILSFQRILLCLFLHTFVHSKRSRASFIIHSFIHSINLSFQRIFCLFLHSLGHLFFHSKGSCASSFFIHSFFLSFQRILCLLFLHSLLRSFIHSFLPSIHLFFETQLGMEQIFIALNIILVFYGIIEFVWNFIHAMFNISIVGLATLCHVCHFQCKLPFVQVGKHHRKVSRGMYMVTMKVGR